MGWQGDTKRFFKGFGKGIGRFLDPGGIFGTGQQAQWQPEEYMPVEGQWDPQARAAYEQLAAAASGRTPSAAELQMQQGIGRAQAAARSQAASMPGMSAGQAARLAAMQQGDLASQGNLQMGALRAQEQDAARARMAAFLEGQQGVEAQRQMMANQWGLTQQQLAAQMELENAKLRQLHQGGVLSAAGGFLGGIL